MTRVGITSYLAEHDGFVVVSKPEERPHVVVFAADKLTADVTDRLQHIANRYSAPVVLLVSEMADPSFLTAVENRVVAILPRTAATGEQLIDAIRAAERGGGVMSLDCSGEQLRQSAVMQREVIALNGLSAAGLQPREIHILRLISEGWNTDQIADELKYSERTVKNVIYHLTTRLHLRNRAHAVAYAVRAGII